MKPAFRILLAAAVMGAVIAVPTPASAGVTIQVQTTLDDDGLSGKCTLRSAIRAANNDNNVLFCAHNGSAGLDTIILPAGRYFLTQTGLDQSAVNGDLDLLENVMIQGAGARRTIIDAGGSGGIGERVFDVFNTTATINDLTVTGGNDAGNGGGILNAGDLTLDRVTLTGNTTAFNGGGVFQSSGTNVLEIRNSAIFGNIASFDGGGIGINGPNTTVTNSTISGNFADSDGGGVSVISTSGTSLSSVTISGNRSDADNNDDADGGGLRWSGSSGGVLVNSLVAGNSDGSGTNAPDCRIDSLNLVTNNNNLIGNTSNCGFPAGSGNILDVDAKIKPLANNGGPTNTHALRAASPARNAGSGCPSTDQRGAPRGAGCDVGAYDRLRCRGIVVNRVGTNGNDVLFGSPGRDGILGLDGADVLLGLNGKDGLCGGEDGDILRGGRGRDRLSGGRGGDVLRGGRGKDRLRGGRGPDLLRGGRADDRLRGGRGSDVCNGGLGIDTVGSCEQQLNIP